MINTTFNKPKIPAPVRGDGELKKSALAGRHPGVGQDAVIAAKWKELGYGG